MAKTKSQPNELAPLYKKTSTGARQVWSVRVQANANGTADIITTFGQVGGKLREEVETITAGKNLGHANETTPLEQAHLEAAAKWKQKRDRKHYGLDEAASESAEKRGAAPMLAKVYKDHAGKIDWTTSFAQYKYDGFRLLADKVDDQIIFWSREGKNFQLAHLAEVLQSVMKNGDRFDGEIYQHGTSLNKIASLVKRPQAGTEQLTYHVYDMPVALRFGERIHLVQQRLRGLDQDRHRVAAVKTIEVFGEEELMNFQAAAIDAGFEGAMLRWGELPYEAGKRSDRLLKVKTFLTAEFVIVAVKQGKGPYAGMAIFTCTTAAGHQFDCTAPGTLDEKRAWWVARDTVVGRQLEVQYAGFTNTDAPVPWHPVAKGVREQL